MKKDFEVKIVIDEVKLMTEVQKTVCSMQCPSVKKEGEKWTHHETCRALRAWLVYNHEITIEVLT